MSDSRRGWSLFSIVVNTTSPTRKKAKNAIEKGASNSTASYPRTYRQLSVGLDYQPLCQIFLIIATSCVMRRLLAEMCTVPWDQWQCQICLRCTFRDKASVVVSVCYPLVIDILRQDKASTVVSVCYPLVIDILRPRQSINSCISMLPARYRHSETRQSISSCISIVPARYRHSETRQSISSCTSMLPARYRHSETRQSISSCISMLSARYRHSETRQSINSCISMLLARYRHSETQTKHQQLYQYVTRSL